MRNFKQIRLNKLDEVRTKLGMKKKMSAYGTPLGRTPGAKTHFVYQINVPKTKQVVYRGDEEGAKEWIRSKSKHFIHKGKDFAIYKGTFPNVKPSDKIDFSYVHKEEKENKDGQD